MSQISNQGKNLILRSFFNGETVIPADFYIGLATAAITPDDSLADIEEEDDANYERQLITFTDPEIDNQNHIVTIKNDSIINFPQYAAEATKLVTWCFITDELTGTTGDLLGAGELNTPLQLPAGETVIIDVGDQEIKFLGGVS